MHVKKIYCLNEMSYKFLEHFMELIIEKVNDI